MTSSVRFLLSLVCTAAAGALVAATAVLFLSGGGHGWNATAVSATSAILGPLGVTAWFFRKVTAGK